MRAIGPVRHSGVVRTTHWIVTLAFFALLLSGVEILLSHPRFYWGETGNVTMAPLFTLPLPASRATVPTGYKFVLPDQNGWSRSLHFEAAWAVVLAGLLYWIAGLATRHFRKDLLPAGRDLSMASLSGAVVSHLRLRPPGSAAEPYNVLQRMAYLSVVFVLFPLAVWTGLAMSPGVVAAFPATVTLLGGQQSARTIHFFASLGLVAFVVAHILMVAMSGFGERVRAMITGRTEVKENA